jgi:hypothetical protein
MTSAIEDALRRLTGLPFWDSGRAVELKKFGFGDERPITRHGRSVVAGEWELHLTCGWRLADGVGILVGNGDVFRVAQAHQEASWDAEGGNVCDVRCAAIFRNQALTVRSHSVRSRGGATIKTSNGLYLEIWPNSWTGEQWRLFVPGTSTNHFVVETIDGVVKAGWE